MLTEYELFISKMKKLTGIDLSLYKEEQMKRRLSSLKDRYQMNRFQDYFEMISHDPEKLSECLDRMTINVSGFFRNKKRWDVLEQDILPGLIKRKNGRFKVWSAACSTGEEPYTLSIILSRHLPMTDFEILATDIDEKVLQKAKNGVYDKRALLECSDEAIDKYFQSDGGKYHIKPKWQTPIRFKKQDLLHGAYETSFDLIVCRNVLIYFTEDAKNRIYKKFSNALNLGGILFIGSTEQIFHPWDFQFKSATTFFYQRLGRPEIKEKSKSSVGIVQ